MNRASTEVPIEIENREVTITVRAPTPPARLAIANQMPDLNALTFEEIHRTCLIFVSHTTDLPQSLIEQLSATTIQPLVEAAVEVIEQDYQEQRRRSREFERHMDGVPNNKRVESILEFVEGEHE